MHYESQSVSIIFLVSLVKSYNGHTTRDIIRVYGTIVDKTSSLHPISYDEIMQLDSQLNKASSKCRKV
jgi:hypothetical protein